MPFLSLSPARNLVVAIQKPKSGSGGDEAREGEACFCGVTSALKLFRREKRAQDS